MQDALPELEVRCANPDCGAVVPQPGHRRKLHCSHYCAQKMVRRKEKERCATLTHKVCRDCEEEKPIEEFRPATSLRCVPCMKVVRAKRYQERGGKEWMYEQNLATRYGMTIEEYRRRVAAQDGRCAICGDEPDDGKRLHVDHSHDTGVVRDLLCRWCNYALGNAKDDPARLRAMADYLDRHSRQTDDAGSDVVEVAEKPT